jgi:hypothetical protein
MDQLMQEVSEWSLIISTGSHVSSTAGPLNDSKVSRAEEEAAAKKCCWKEVSPSTEQRMQPVQQISARCASRISPAESWKTAHGGLMGCGERPGGLLRGTFGPLPVCHSANKTRVIHTEDNPTPGMIARCPKLQERWREATHTEITGGIKKGFRFFQMRSVSGTAG